MLHLIDRHIIRGSVITAMLFVLRESFLNTSEFNALIVKARARQDDLLLRKGADYTRHDVDRLSNFKRNATSIGLTSLQVWAVYFNKHIDAIMAYVKTGKAESEAITGRIDDAINYLYLLEGLIEEETK